MIEHCLKISPQQESSIIRNIKQSNESFLPINKQILMTPKSDLIRVGIKGGLPFDNLMTDLVVGCLPVDLACYGCCFAAKSSWENGMDFGSRIANHLDIDIFKEDLDALPITNRYIRNGWNSDPSWEWNKAAEVSKLIRESGRLPIFITKVFKAPGLSALNNLALFGAEIRVSISALDTNQQLKSRLEFLQNYRKAGGVAIPLVMSAYYTDQDLLKRQKDLVRWVLENDFPGAENSLRFVKNTPMSTMINHGKTGDVYDENQEWSGRLFINELVFPTTTSIPDNYTGITSGFMSKLDQNHIRSLFIDEVIEHNKILSNKAIISFPPQKCGISRFNAPA